MSLVIAAIDGSDISKWIFIFFFLILPIIRSILGKSEKALKGGGQPEEEPDDFEFDDEEEDYSDGEAWGRLLRDEPTVAKVEPTPTRSGRGVIPKPLYGAVESVDRDSLAHLRELEAVSPNKKLHETVTHITGLQSESSPFSDSSEHLSADFAGLEERTEAPTFERASVRRRRNADWREAIRTREILGLPVALRRGASEIPGFR